MTFRAIIFFFSVLGISCTRNYIPQTGDLLFQDLDCGELCDAIEKVTSGADGANLSHIGIVSVENDTAFVYEAIGRGVTKTLLENFFDRSRDSLGNPKILSGRIDRKYDYTISAAIQYCRHALNQPYDDVFDLENEQYYCSELVYFAFKDSTENHLFEVTPMTFKDPATGETFPAWENYYRELNASIPEGKPGLNPGGISRSDNIKIVHRFYEP
jgi:hypothetical protein